MRSFNPSEPIQLEDGEYTFIETGGALVKLRSVKTGEYITMHMAELGQRIVGLPPVSIRNARLVASLGEKQQDRTLTIADHLREILTGEHPALDKPRPQFDLTTTTQTQRVNAKLAELEATIYKMGRSSLMAKLAAFKVNGEAALVDGRALTTKAVAKDDRVTVVEALVEVIGAQRGESTVTAARLIELTSNELLNQYGADRPDLPSNRTMYRLIKIYTKGKHTTGSAQTRRSAGDRPNRPFGKATQLLPGAEFQLDSTPMNIFVRVPGCKTPMRPHLAIMVDVATRSILAYTFRLVAAKGVDHVGLITQALVPIQNQPDRTRFRDMVELQNKGLTLLSQAELMRLAHHRPFMYPRVLVIDNGKDFKSNVAIRAAESFGMGVRFSPPRTPITKGIVERTFLSIKTLFEENLPGFTGGSVEMRGEDVQNRDKLLDIFAVQELFHDWVLSTWQNRPHRSLTDPLFPEQKWSPNQVAAAAARVVGDIEIPLTREDYIRLLPFTQRSLTSTGFRHQNHFYDAPELHQYRGRVATMRILFDPYNPSTVWAAPADGTLIECTIRDWNAMNRPFFGLMTVEDDELEQADARLAQRAAIALIGSKLAGTPLHQAPTEPKAALLPADFDDENDVEALPEFTTEGN